MINSETLMATFRNLSKPLLLAAIILAAVICLYVWDNKKKKKLFKEIEENVRTASIEELERYLKRLSSYEKSIGDLMIAGLMADARMMDNRINAETLRLIKLVEENKAERLSRNSGSW